MPKRINPCISRAQTRAAPRWDETQARSVQTKTHADVIANVSDGADALVDGKLRVSTLLWHSVPVHPAQKGRAGALEHTQLRSAQGYYLADMRILSEMSG